MRREKKRKPKKEKAAPPADQVPFASPTAHDPSRTETSGSVSLTRGAPSYGVVFVNGPGAKTYERHGERGNFPVGTVIVREARVEPDNEIPQSVLVMIKRAKGFNPGGGDWEFISADGIDLKIREKQTTGRCLDCHKAGKKTDFVFKSGSDPNRR